MTNTSNISRTTLLTAEDILHIRNGFEVLLALQEGGVDPKLARERLKQYGPGAKDREELFILLQYVIEIGNLPTQNFQLGDDWDAPRPFWRD